MHLAVLQGTLDDGNPLSKLRGNGLILGKVFGDVDEFYERHIDRGSTAFLLDAAIPYYPPFRVPRSQPGDLPWTKWDFKFPEPTNINVNMMPFNFFRVEETLPKELHAYIPMIKSCNVQRCEYGPDGRLVGNRYNRVMYLTVHESPVVTKGSTQRRPGLHIDRPGAIVDGGRFVKPQPWGANEFTSLAWGLGYSRDGFPIDGIYLATSCPNSCRVFDALIEKPEEVTDVHGGVEHMRRYLGQGVDVEANKLHWITDRTPHEALPMEQDGVRQFFRLVVGRISVWYAAHNTANPLVEPDAPIVHGDKFSVVSPWL